MRLDHLLSKERISTACVLLFRGQWLLNISGGDALRGHTRSHPEHDG